MTPEEIQAMAKGLAEGQAIWYVLSAILGGFITGTGAYLAEKGKNRATKEDIGEITKAVEAAKAEFSRQLEDLKAHHQLRMVAAERRLQAHQEAYSLWHKLYSVAIHANRETTEIAANEMLVWYNQNCIFLGSKGRDAVMTAIKASFNNLHLKDNAQSINQWVDNWNLLESTQSALLAEIDLPGLTSSELHEISNPPS